MDLMPAFVAVIFTMTISTQTRGRGLDALLYSNQQPVGEKYAEVHFRE